MSFIDISILDAAARCGIQVNRNNVRAEMRANCPFCGDSKGHLYLNTQRNVFYCQKCDEHGNSITLYAKLYGKNNSESYKEMLNNMNICDFSKTVCNVRYTALNIKPLDERNRVYNTMLNMLELSQKHKLNLLDRGLSALEIEKNMYKSVPKKYSKLYSQVMFELSNSFNLYGVPGFYKHNENWHMYSTGGFFIPVRDRVGNIQGMQIRLDNESDSKYKWFSSN